MKGDRRVVSVWADWVGVVGPRRMGTLSATSIRGREVFAFEYEPEWLDSKHARVLDPTLRLFRGPQFHAQERGNFGVFLDSSPDRWGRVLLDRREALRARAEGRSERRLRELDYLLGVFDGHRLGGLRFSIGDGPFLDDDASFASPPWASLRELEAASLALEQDGAEADPAFSRWLTMLIAPGRSLGGARPKASIVDPDGALWLAKFPSQRDDRDVGGWEWVAHLLAQRAGVVTAEGRAERFAHRHHTFLSRRFDRRAEGGRVHFASAMTLLQRADGDEGASYLELAELLAREGAQTARDLEQLWRRIVFFVCISNVDDHLQNHGFLLGPRGWELAPAYDVNPVPHGSGLVLNISETDNALDLELVRATARHFRVKPARATEVIREVISAVSGWRQEAAEIGFSRSEIESMASAFRIADAAAELRR